MGEKAGKLSEQSPESTTGRRNRAARAPGEFRGQAPSRTGVRHPLVQRTSPRSISSTPKINTCPLTNKSSTRCRGSIFWLSTNKSPRLHVLLMGSLLRSTSSSGVPSQQLGTGTAGYVVCLWTLSPFATCYVE